MDRRIEEVLRVLERDWRKDHRITELALSVNLCPSRLQHLVKEVTDRSIRELVQSRRLDEAASAIASTYERISSIAYFVGFRDIPNFNHAFRRRFGMSPREYRRRAIETARAAESARTAETARKGDGRDSSHQRSAEGTK
jgi:transcriptional regulator GlxA family with amidase domain